MSKTDEQPSKKRKYNKVEPKRKYRQPLYIDTTKLGKKNEYKFVDKSYVAASLNLTPQIQLLNGCQVGSAFYNRIGRKIMMKSVQLNMDLDLTGTENTDFDYGRIIIVYDRNPNGAFPVIGDILADYTDQGVNSTNITSFPNPNNKQRFIIVRDMKLTLAPFKNDAIAAYSISPSYIQGFEGTCYAKLNLEVDYRASSNPAVIGDIANGSLYLVTFGGYAAGTEAYKIRYSSRVKYLDI